jgi:hypothetical protein
MYMYNQIIFTTSCIIPILGCRAALNKNFLKISFFVIEIVYFIDRHLLAFAILTRETKS